jgi:O-antigen ligase
MVDESMTEWTRTFEKSVPKWNDLNFGIILISVYYILDLGSIQGLFPIISSLKIPFIVSGVSIGYAIILFLSNSFDRTSGVTKTLFFLFLFTIIYSLISTGSSLAKTELIKVCLIYYANYIIVVSSVKKVSQFVFIVDILLLSIAFSCYNGIHQGGLIWGSRWFNDENQLSLLADIGIPFATVFLVIHKSKLKKIFYLFCIFTYSILNVIAYSRGGTLGLLLAVLLCVLVMKNKIRILLFMLVVTTITFHYAPPKFFEEMATLEQGTQEQTADDRLYLWGIALDMFKNHPLLGVGPMNYSFYFIDYEKHVRYTSTNRVAHSTPLENLAETGLLGVFFFLLLQIQLYKNWRRSVLKKRLVAKNINNNLHSLRLIGHACAISQLVFHWCSLFLTLFMFPFYWCLLPLSEAWKNISTEGNPKKNIQP